MGEHHPDSPEEGSVKDKHCFLLWDTVAGRGGLRNMYPGIHKGSCASETTWSSFAAVSEVQLMVLKLPGDWISRYMLL